RLRGVLGGRGQVENVGIELTRRHGDVVQRLLSLAGLSPSTIHVIGFHGQTILHEPDKHRTWQIGDGALLASITGIDTVSDFRSADVAAGGQGAPFVPLYHRALAARLPKPLAVLNIGGVANVSFIGDDDDALLAFDTGPGNAMIDDWALRHTGTPVDEGGRLALSGRIDRAALDRLMSHSYFEHPVPKSLDRDAFDPAAVAHLSPADGAATLVAFTSATVARSRQALPEAPKRWLVTGGGRRNPALMTALRTELGVPVDSVE